MVLDDYFSASGVCPDEFIKPTWNACVYEDKSYAILGGAAHLCAHAPTWLWYTWCIMASEAR